MRFIADSMLGRLARWLRLLGHDTLYYPHIEGSLLLRIAREEDRNLLTRDTRLVKVRGLKNYLLLSSNDPFDQLKTVITAFNLLPAGTSRDTDNRPLCSRCSLCNSVLARVTREQARHHVPEYVYHTTVQFSKCQKCSKYYWKGTHYERLEHKLREIL